LLAMDDTDGAREAHLEAYEGRRKLMPSDMRPADALNYKDYDDLVIFWSQ
jgi:hypothetical protein